MRIALLILAVLAFVASLALVVRFVALARLSQERSGRGLSTDAGASPLAPCPARPGCARLELPGQGGIQRAREALERLPRLRVVTATATYLHAEVRSRLFGFVDDVEIRWDGGTDRLELRSASRVGHSDLGANAARLERLRRTITTGD